MYPRETSSVGWTAAAVTANVAGANILVVEDQRAVAGALRMRLRGLGYDVVGIAKDGNEAIERARELRPDLILMDIRLGEGIDGIEAAHLIRTQYDIPVVYVSAYADRDLLDRARATQPAGFINKPFTTKDLLTTINLALHKQEEARQQDQVGGREAKDQEAIITADRDARITFVNRHAERLTGWTRDALIGQPLANILMTLYELNAQDASAVVRRTFKLNTEQAVLADDKSGKDTLKPLTDARGQCFGVALRMSESTTRASLAAMSQASSALRFVFDQLPMAMVLVDKQLKLLYINQMADGIFNAHSTVAIVRGQLRATSDQDHANLANVVQRAAARGQLQAPDEVTSEICTLRADDDRRVILVATPVPADGNVTVALLVFESPGYRPVSAQVLQQIYGLTRAEIVLVQALASGHSLEEAAHVIGIAVNTARTHLKHIFIKTGAKRQSELIHQVETGPASLPLRLEDPL
ncbi:MAG: response regulator [Gammaproteobacteria bacterium]|nr:response regulator [Gammaproteobacteria bacterium]